MLKIKKAAFGCLMMLPILTQAATTETADQAIAKIQKQWHDGKSFVANLPLPAGFEDRINFNAELGHSEKGLDLVNNKVSYYFDMFENKNHFLLRDRLYVEGNPILDRLHTMWKMEPNAFKKRAIQKKIIGLMTEASENNSANMAEIAKGKYVAFVDGFHRAQPFNFDDLTKTITFRPQEGGFVSTKATFSCDGSEPSVKLHIGSLQYKKPEKKKKSSSSVNSLLDLKRSRGLNNKGFADSTLGVNAVVLGMSEELKGKFEKHGRGACQHTIAFEDEALAEKIENGLTNKDIKLGVTFRISDQIIDGQLSGYVEDILVYQRKKYDTDAQYKHLFTIAGGDTYTYKPVATALIDEFLNNHYGDFLTGKNGLIPMGDFLSGNKVMRDRDMVVYIDPNGKYADPDASKYHMVFEDGKNKEVKLSYQLTRKDQNYFEGRLKAIHSYDAPNGVELSYKELGRRQAHTFNIYPGANRVIEAPYSTVFTDTAYRTGAMIFNFGNRYMAETAAR